MNSSGAADVVCAGRRMLFVLVPCPEDESQGDG